MKIEQVSFGFTTRIVQETKEFYLRNLGAELIFEKEGYACLKLGDIRNVLSIEAPQSPGDKPSDSAGLGLGITVEDVDRRVSMTLGHLVLVIKLQIEQRFGLVAMAWEVRPAGGMRTCAVQRKSFIGQL